jgi:hypothetical protein
LSAPQVVRVEPARGLDPGAVGLHDDVGHRGEPSDQILAFRAVEVGDDAPLVRRVRLPHVGGITPGSGLVVPQMRNATPSGAPRWRFDLDDIGAQVGEHAPGEQAPLVREVENAQSVKESHRAPSAGNDGQQVREFT